MTVFKLTMTLLWKMLTFQVKPNSLVVREYYHDYTTDVIYFKNIVFVDALLPMSEHLCGVCMNNPCACDGIHHRMFGTHGNGPARNLVRLD